MRISNPSSLSIIYGIIIESSNLGRFQSTQQVYIDCVVHPMCIHVFVYIIGKWYILC